MCMDRRRLPPSLRIWVWLPLILLIGAEGAHALAQGTSKPHVVAKIRTAGIQPCGIASLGQWLFVANYGSQSLVRIDSRTNKRGGRIAIGYEPCGLVAGGGAIWV